LVALLDEIDPRREDVIVTLGDYIDRGPDSRGVLDCLIALTARCTLVPLMGDHEELLLDSLTDLAARKRWLANGGGETLRSYGWSPDGGRRGLAEWIPEDHRKFVAGCKPYYETATHIFMHAGFVPDLPMSDQPAQALRWRVTNPKKAAPHCSGKSAIVGHTAQFSGEVLNLKFLICIDTNCVRGGWLTALDVESGAIWQADRDGKLRANTSPLPAPG
jgi:serine/threonine protein phosphatase 1